MAVEFKALLDQFEKAFPDAKITLTDLVGDGDHYQVEIKDPQFQSMNRIQQHRRVHEVLGDQLGRQLHALSIKTSAL